MLIASGSQPCRKGSLRLTAAYSTSGSDCAAACDAAVDVFPVIAGSPKGGIGQLSSGTKTTDEVDRDTSFQGNGRSR
jgi:hypothetical protein